VLVAHTSPPHQPALLANPIPSGPNIFLAFVDLPFEMHDTTLQVHPTVDNKADTLMQSQMLKDNESHKFIPSQKSFLASWT
jgi:hypothetical protein